LVPTSQSHYKETIISTAEKTPNVVNIVSYSGVSNCALALGFWIKNTKHYNGQQQQVNVNE
jgi:inosine-uridine nucleoside N-ribohydrolase